MTSQQFIIFQRVVWGTYPSSWMGVKSFKIHKHMADPRIQFWFEATQVAKNNILYKKFFAHNYTAAPVFIGKCSQNRKSRLTSRTIAKNREKIKEEERQ